MSQTKVKRVREGIKANVPGISELVRFGKDDNKTIRIAERNKYDSLCTYFRIHITPAIAQKFFDETKNSGYKVNAIRQPQLYKYWSDFMTNEYNKLKKEYGTVKVEL